MYQMNPDTNTRSWKDATVTQISDKAVVMQTPEGKTVKQNKINVWSRVSEIATPTLTPPSFLSPIPDIGVAQEHN